MTISQKELFLNGWRSPDTYDPEFAPLPNAPAVYCVAAVQLYPSMDRPLNFEVAYVGMSMNVANRLDRNHAAMLRIEEEDLWPQRFFKLCDPAGLRSLERRLIRFYQPRLNIVGKSEPLQ